MENGSLRWSALITLLKKRLRRTRVRRMLRGMKPPTVAEPDDLIIDTRPRKPRRRRWVLAGLTAFVLLAMTRALPLYIDALWFGSTGYASVFWYTFRLQAILFAVFAGATFLILRGVSFVLGRVFSSLIPGRRSMVLNDQPVVVAPGRILRALGWITSVVLALFYGLGMSGGWQAFALYLNQPATSIVDPVFQKPLGFFLFTLPVYDLLSGWLSTLAVVTLLATGLYAAASIPEKGTAGASGEKGRRRRYAALSCALAAVLAT